ncbi:6-bladed beta-propeller [Sulfurimonas sp.]|uniref:6-bladed beta-propeller n=1 Tax=Sulfurimonas sp. TaxID=2022749 RepID=UPI003563CCCF
MMKAILPLFALIIAILFQGCTTKAPKPKQTIVFPSYPEEPRILYLDTYRGGLEEKEYNAFDVFIGEEKIDRAQSNIIKPYGVGLLNGKVYAVDTGSKLVFVMDEKTRELDLIGTSAVGSLSAPVSIAFDANNTIYVSDSRQKRILGYDSQGKLKYSLGDRLEFARPTGIAINKSLNRLYVVDTKAHHFKAYELSTKKHLFTVGKRGKGDGEFNFPTNVAVDQRNGHVVVVDTQNFRVQIFDQDGNFISKFGSIGNKSGTFARPKGVGIDSDGNIYVADGAFNNIQIFDETGTKYLMYFGGAGYTETRFRLIAGMYIDENDKIVVADGFSGRVQTFQYLSEKWKKENQQKYKELKEFKPEM